jgi:hypothetical protein
MLSMLVAITARFAVLAVTALIFSQLVRHMPRNKLCRFAISFVLWVPLGRVINYVYVSTQGYHKMSWTETFIIALLLAIWGTFCLPQTAT